MLILDTSFIVSYYNIRDENHKRAVELMKDIVNKKYGSLYITDYIFDESITVILIRLKSFSKTIAVGKLIRKSAEMLWIEKDTFEEAWKLFRGQKKTAFSFTDCTTLGIMEKRNVKNIVTFDEDFKKIKGVNVIGIE
ncbi:MAG: PIN domain-containing protein [Candidatus Aenigmarchaeota archaeon]|nr:PIN domain-containing protein [Candidatus Aenigmarchaeota archaeon]